MNYIQLQQQIINRLDNRTDLAQVVYDYSQQRITHWQNFLFYSSDISDTSITTTPGLYFYGNLEPLSAIRSIRLLIPGNTQGLVNVSTTTTAAVTLPATTIPVVSTAGFLATGPILINDTQLVYASVDATNFRTCVGGLPGVAPSGSTVQQLFGIWMELKKIDYYELIGMDVLQPSLQAQPFYWAPFNTQFRLFPTPPMKYTLEVTGNQAPAAPTLDTDDNFWTEAGAQLIINATVAEVYENYLHDDASAQSFRKNEQRDYRTLLKKTFNLGDPMIIRSHL